MHFAKIENNKPLQDILTLLRERGERGATTAEIHSYASVENPATWVSALRKNGYSVECKYVGLSENKRKVYNYRLVG